MSIRPSAFSVLFLLGVSLLSSMSPADEPKEPPTARQLVERDGVLVIAHRGDNKRAPENTLPAFKSAVEAGSDLVELDYFHSSDGVPIVFHDDDLDEKTNAIALWGGKKIPTESKTFAELRKLDAGSWFGPAFRGTQIPTLEEALDTIQTGSTTLIERKQGDAATCVELLSRKKIRDRVVVQAFDWDYLADCHRQDPSLVLCALGEEDLGDDRLDQIRSLGAAAVGWNDKHLTKAMIERIHARGLKAWVWTVNDPKRAAELIDWGIDGLITDVPRTMLELISKRPAR